MHQMQQPPHTRHCTVFKILIKKQGSGTHGWSASALSCDFQLFAFVLESCTWAVSVRL